jgi:recombinational DNA repair ATPase RecF
LKLRNELHPKLKKPKQLLKRTKELNELQKLKNVKQLRKGKLSLAEREVVFVGRNASGAACVALV